MKILIQGDNLENYLAKCHEAFRTGLKALYEVRSFGIGYAGYKANYISFRQIIEKLYNNEQPDVIISDSLSPIIDNFPSVKKFADSDFIKGLRCTQLSDYWSELNTQNEQKYFEKVSENKIDFILSYFIQPIENYSDKLHGCKFIFLPPAFDPKIFNDWGMTKEYDVSFLAYGTTNYSDFYPERYEIHHILLKERKINYLWAEHPGWKNHSGKSALIGKNFSQALNSSKISITTAGVYKNAHAKYIEILASKSLLLAEEPIGFEKIGLIDGVNYVKINKSNLLDQIYYYLSHPEITDEITNEGYKLAINRHNCFARATDFYNEINSKLRSNGK